MPRIVQRAIDLIVGDTWPKRRRVIYATLLFCAMLIAFAMGAAVAAHDMNAVVAIAGNAFLLGGSVIGSYVFGSIWDDRDKRKHLPPATPSEETVE